MEYVEVKDIKYGKCIQRRVMLMESREMKTVSLEHEEIKEIIEEIRGNENLVSGINQYLRERRKRPSDVVKFDHLSEDLIEIISRYTKYPLIFEWDIISEIDRQIFGSTPEDSNFKIGENLGTPIQV